MTEPAFLMTAHSKRMKLMRQVGSIEWLVMIQGSRLATCADKWATIFPKIADIKLEDVGVTT